MDQQAQSQSEIIARHLPAGVPVVAAFKTMPASLLAGASIIGGTVNHMEKRALSTKHSVVIADQPR
jgi:predicted dinucleotide-binding enzyme